jgi:hypothetical protein
MSLKTVFWMTVLMTYAIVIWPLTVFWEGYIRIQTRVKYGKHH